MQQQTDHDNFFYEYFPQFPYPERSLPCNPVQDYQLREIHEKSKVVLPVAHHLPFRPPPAHVTTLQNVVPINIPQNITPQNINSNIQPALQSTIPHSQPNHHAQNVVTSATPNITAAIELTSQSYEAGNENIKNHSTSKKKRTRLRHMINPEEWMRNKNKKARMLGQAYIGWIKRPDGKYILGADRKALECGPPCDCKRSKRGKELKCGQLHEKERKTIFDKTCSMSWEAKKVWVQSHVEALEPRKKTPIERHRTMSIAYYLPICSGKRKRVCRNMFLSTLGRNRRQVESWIKEGRLSLPQDSQKCSSDPSDSSEEEDVSVLDKSHLSVEEKIGKINTLIKPGEESKKLLRKKAYLDKRKKVRDFLDALPKTSLHNALYLDSNFKTGASLYKYYKESVDNSMYVSSFVFFQEMKTKRIKLLKPKKGSNHLRHPLWVDTH